MNNTDGFIVNNLDNGLNTTKNRFGNITFKSNFTFRLEYLDEGIQNQKLLSNYSTTAKDRPFTNEKLSTALSPNMERQERDRKMMLKRYQEKPRKFSSLSEGEDHMTSVVSRINQGIGL